MMKWENSIERGEESDERRAMPNFLNSKELDSRPQPASRELRSTLVERPLQFQPFFAKRTQFPKSQISTMLYFTRTYESWTIGQIGKTNPKRTQFKANSNPIRTQSNPIQSRRLTQAIRGFAEVLSLPKELITIYEGKKWGLHH